MVVDQLVQQIQRKKNPCIVGIDPEWGKLPGCYTSCFEEQTDAIWQWAKDVIDAVADIVPAVKPQMAFFEVFGAEGMATLQRIVAYAHEKGLLVVDDSKRNDIGNTAKAYAFAHLAKNGPINADFMTVSPFLGSDSLQPLVDAAEEYGKGLFILVKTSNPGSVEISEAKNAQGQTVSHWLAEYVRETGRSLIGKSGYSSIGAVVGATFPEEAALLREKMKNSFFLVPGYGAQGGDASDVVPCFNEDGLGAVVNASRSILYHHMKLEVFDQTREMYRQIVREQATQMRDAVYGQIKKRYSKMVY